LDKRSFSPIFFSPNIQGFEVLQYLLLSGEKISNVLINRALGRIGCVVAIGGGVSTFAILVAGGVTGLASVFTFGVDSVLDGGVDFGFGFDITGLTAAVAVAATAAVFDFYFGFDFYFTGCFCFGAGACAGAALDTAVCPAPTSLRLSKAANALPSAFAENC
jgi:hypothetical protein